MKKKLQQDLKATLDAADALSAKVAGENRGPNADEVKDMQELAAKATALQSQIKSLTDLELAKQFANEPDGKAFVPAMFSDTIRPEDGTLPGVTMDPESGELHAIDGEFKSVGEKKLAALKGGGYKDAFATWIRSKGLNREQTMKGDAMKVLSEGSDVTGGFWLPPDFRPELQKKMAAMASVRPNASVFVTGTDHITFPAVNYNGDTSDDTYANLFTSGVRFSWRNSLASTSDFTEATNPIAGQINIPVQLATCSIIVTREQLEDNSFDILGYITALGAEAFALGEESAFTNGTGAGQPQGFMVHPTMIGTTANRIGYSTYATRAGSTYWGNCILSGTTTIAWGSATTGIIGCEAQTPPQYENNAKWFAAKTTYASIRAINSGTATLPQWSLGDAYPNYANGMKPSLLGYSTVKNQFVDSTLQTGHAYLAFGDLSGYYIVDRVGLSVDVNPYIYQNRDQVLIYMRKRTGGQLVQYWKMKVLAST